MADPNERKAPRLITEEIPKGDSDEGKDADIDASSDPEKDSPSTFVAFFHQEIWPKDNLESKNRFKKDIKMFLYIAASLFLIKWIADILQVLCGILS